MSPLSFPFSITPSLAICSHFSTLIALPGLVSLNNPLVTFLEASLPSITTTGSLYIHLLPIFLFILLVSSLKKNLSIFFWVFLVFLHPSFPYTPGFIFRALPRDKKRNPSRKWIIQSSLLSIETKPNLQPHFCQTRSNTQNHQRLCGYQ